MKRLLPFIFLVGLFSASSLLFTSCTKEGPQGPAGEDANATCSQCHNFSDDIVAKIFQYDASTHATGALAFENLSSCAACHTSQGFIETIGTGADTTATTISNPAPINCRTCHKIHKTYSIDDWSITTAAAFNLRIDKTISIDLQGGDGSSNLCGRCHQARAVSPWVTNPLGSDSLKASNDLWGPHNGPQVLIFAGKGLFEFDTPYGNSSHRDNASCSSCHMTNAVGNITGGHTWKISNEEVGDNFSGCNVEGCHKSAPVTPVWYADKETAMIAKWNILRDKLLEKNLIDSTNAITYKLKHTQKEFAAVWNFRCFLTDRSNGMHNYRYVSDMLDATTAILE